MIKKLPEEAKKELDLAFKASKNSKETNRIQVLRLLSKGLSHKQVSEITDKSEPSIQALVKIYNQQGLTGLRLKSHPRNNSKLSIKQKEKIKEILNKYETPKEAGVKVFDEDNFWSIQTVKALVKKMFSIEYKNKDSYRKLLKYCGYTYQRVEFEDARKSNQSAEDFKHDFKIKLKKGVMRMSW